MSARDAILSNLRRALDRPDLRFPPVAPPPLTRETRLAVTSVEGAPHELAQRFGQELTALHGSYEVVSGPTMARMALISHLQEWMEEEEASHKGKRLETGQEQSILSWDVEQLPVPGLGPALADLELTVVSPPELRSEEVRESVRFIRYGVTGVEAAFASTGSMLMASSAPGTSRAASLLPFRHVALIPFSRIFPTVEAWLANQRQHNSLLELMNEHANLTMVSGPSKSADIEGQLTLGVHGPKFVHAILFDDAAQTGEADPAAEDEPGGSEPK